MNGRSVLPALASGRHSDLSMISSSPCRDPICRVCLSEENLYISSIGNKLLGITAGYYTASLMA